MLERLSRYKYLARFIISYFPFLSNDSRELIALCDFFIILSEAYRSLKNIIIIIL